MPAYYSEFLYGVNMTVGFYRFQGLMCPIVIQHLWVSKVCYNGYMNMGFGAWCGLTCMAWCAMFTVGRVCPKSMYDGLVSHTVAGSGVP